jgi:DNA-binding LacI/PurR family transcriptional regulator
VADVAVTMDDVAARAGVSRAAVSLALRNSPKVSAARREQILQVAAELGYRPNINASRLARARTGTIGVVFSDLHNALYAEMLDGLAGALGDGPEQLLLASGFHDPDRPARFSTPDLGDSAVGVRDTDRDRRSPRRRRRLGDRR